MEIGVASARDGFDDGASLADSSVSGRPQYGVIMSLPVLIVENMETKCCCCGCTTAEKSPFLSSTEDDAYGGLRPWSRYARCTRDVNYKSPHGKICQICWNVFKLTGLNLVHGTIAKYLSSTRNAPEEHRGFMKAVKTYIAQVNTDPDTERSFLKKACTEARTTVDEEHRSGTRRLTRRTFILEKVFAETYADKPRYANLAKEKDVVNLGAELGDQPGFWVAGAFNTHLPGHHEFQDYSDTSTVMRKRHEDGKCQVSKTQAVDKFAALAGIHAAEKRKCESKMSALSASDLLAMACSSFGSSGAASAQETGSNSEQAASEAPETVSDDDPVDSDLDPGRDFRSETLVALGRPGAKAKSAAAKAKAQASKTPTGASSVGGSGGAGGRGKHVGRAGPSSPAPEVVSLVSDGRWKRLKEGVEQELGKLRADAAEVCDMSELVDEEGSMGIGSAFLKALKGHSKKCVQVAAALRLCLSRIDRSANKDGLESERQELDNLQGKVQHASDVLKVLSCAATPSVDALEALSIAIENGVKLSKTMSIIQWCHAMSQQIMFGNYENACELVTKDNAKGLGFAFGCRVETYQWAETCP